MNSQDVTFESDGIRLAGTFTPAAEPVAAAVLITGSGRLNRDSDARLPGGLTLRAGITSAIASALAEAHVSTLRFDKRGIGASGGDYWSTGMPQRLADARAALAWLAGQAPGLPLLAIGHSEGACHAASLAADGNVAGAVLVSGIAQPGGAVLAWQTRQIAATMPLISRAILRLMRTDVVSAQQRNEARILASTQDVMRMQGTKVAARWVRDFVRYDPAPVLARITVPVLAVTGGHDLQVPPADVETMGTLVRGPFTGRVVGDLSHLLRPDPRRAGLRDYRRQVREPVSPDVLGLITGWVCCHWGPR